MNRDAILQAMHRERKAIERKSAEIVNHQAMLVWYEQELAKPIEAKK